MDMGSVAGVVSSVDAAQGGANVRQQLEFVSRPAPHAEGWHNFSMSVYEFEITPLVGVGPVKFGMSRRETRKILKDLFGEFPTPRPAQQDSYLDHLFVISYTDGDENEDSTQAYAVEFGNSSSTDSIEAMFHGKDLFEIPHEECRQHLLQFSNSQPECDELLEIGFSELDMILYKTDYKIEHLRRGYFNILDIGDGTSHEWDLIREQNNRS